MKFRHKMTVMLSAAAALVLVVAVAALAAGGFTTPKPDNVVFNQPTPTVIYTGQTVYTTKAARFYHSLSDCAGMQNPYATTMAEAEADGKTPCKTCVLVWAEEESGLYHSIQNCTGAWMPEQVSLAKAREMELLPCPGCHGTTVSYDVEPAVTSEPINADVSYRITDEDRIMYCDWDNNLYHCTENCGVYRSAQEEPLSEVLQLGYLDPCPECCSLATVYTLPGFDYFHSITSCFGEINGEACTLKEALAMKPACPECVLVLESTVYRTEKGNYFHLLPDCSGMEGAQVGSFREALAEGKGACPVCAEGMLELLEITTAENAAVETHETAAANVAWYLENARYYHSDSTCSGMENPRSALIEDLEEEGKTACPLCFAEPTPEPRDGELLYMFSAPEYVESTPEPTPPVTATLTPWPTPQSTPTPMPAANDEPISSSVGVIGGADGPTAVFVTGQDEIQLVYATSNGVYFHSDPYCSGMQNALRMVRSDLEADGRQPCPICIGSMDETPVTDHGIPFELLTGLTIEEAFPGYVVRESSGAVPADGSSDEEIYTRLVLRNDEKDEVIIAYSKPVQDAEGLLSLQFPADDGGEFLYSNSKLSSQLDFFSDVDAPIAVGALLGRKPETISSSQESATFNLYFVNDRITACETPFTLDDGAAIFFRWEFENSEISSAELRWTAE